MPEEAALTVGVAQLLTAWEEKSVAAAVTLRRGNGKGGIYPG